MTDNPPIKIYANKIENRTTFKIKTGYYLELLLPKTMKLPGSMKIEITKDKNGEILPHLKFFQAVLVPCSIVSNNYQHDSRVLYTFVPNRFFN